MTIGPVKPVVACDFDGVLNTHTRGFVEGGQVVDPPVKGTLKWLLSLAPQLQIVIHSARAESSEGVESIRLWLNDNGYGEVPVTITSKKPATAIAYLDDRGWLINGKIADYPTAEELLAFRPWWQDSEPPALPAISGDTTDQLAASVAARAELMDSDVTETIVRVVEYAGGILDGLDERLKLERRIAGKLENVMAEKDLAAADAAADLKDALRYTAVFDTDAYLAGATAVLEQLAEAGLPATRVRNYWVSVDGSRYADGTYVGINCVLTGLNGFQVELQFHTPQSLDVQAINWPLYALIRGADIPDEDLAAMQQQMRANNALVEAPAGVESFTAAGCLPAAPVLHQLADETEDDETPAGIPARVHYRDAADHKVSCGTCSYYVAGQCTMFEGNPTVSPSKVCDEWQPIEADHSITAAAKPVPPALHNRAVAAAQRRVDELEPRLAAVLQPILEKAGRDAAHAFRARVTDHLTAAIAAEFAETGADITSSSTMVAVYPRPAEAQAIAEDDGEDPGIIHVTLCYLGDTDDDTASRVRDALAVVAGTHPPLEGTVGGVGAFAGDGDSVPSILLPDVPGLVELRTAVCEAVIGAGEDYSRLHGFTAHLTIAYRENGSATPARSSIGQPLHFDSIKLVRGNEVIADFPLTGAPSLTAAGVPQWSAPAPNELIDVDALVASIKAKTDPIRRALVEASMTPALEQAGLSWDVSNPLTARVLAQSGSQIKNIAETTQLNVMRIVRSSYDNGLSIPDTAEAIQQGMTEASTARATLIARTEMAGAVNGGSLAATQIVSQETGTGYYKKWMTAPGAMYPRHEDYEGLDGQTVRLDEQFDVGGSPLQFPGDPDGPPDEVCNCRCTLSYTDNASELTDDSGGYAGDTSDESSAFDPVGSQVPSPGAPVSGPVPLGRPIEKLKVSDDPYLASLQKARYTTGNRISGLQTRHKKGVATPKDYARLEALRVFQQLIRGLNEGGEPTLEKERGAIADEVARVQEVIDRYGSTIELEQQLELLNERQTQLAELVVPPPAPTPTLTTTGSLAGDLTAIKGQAEWLTPSEAARKAAELTQSGYHERYYPLPSSGVHVAPYLQEQMNAVLAAGERVQLDMQIPTSLTENIDRADKLVAQVEADRKAATQPLQEAWEKLAEEMSPERRDQIRDEISQRLFAKPAADLTYLERNQVTTSLSSNPDWAAWVARREAAHQTWMDAQTAWDTKLASARSSFRSAKEQLAVTQRAEALRVLGSIREMGAKGDAKLTLEGKARGYKKAGELLEATQPYYPTDWIQRWRTIEPGIARRGYMKSLGSTRAQIKLSDSERTAISSDPNGFPVALHELGHESEDSVPFVRQVEAAFYEWRTRGDSFTGPQEALRKIYRGEYGRQDKFSELYMGKTYEGKYYEIVSMGVESLFTGSYELDPEYMRFMLGLLALL